MSAEPAAPINDALVQVGEIGKYQLFMLLCASLCCCLTSMTTLALVFAQADMDFRCELSEDMQTGNESWYNKTGFDNVCTYPNTTEPCSSFTYDTSTYESTIVSEFDLVCSKRIIVTVTNMLYMLIRIPGSIIAGRSIDLLGRKKTLMAGLLMLGGTGLATAYSVNVWMYIVFRTLNAIGVMFVFDSCSMFLSEVTAPKQRPHILIGLIYSWGSGICLLTAFAYWIRDWRTLYMAISVPAFAFFIAAYWAFDESPHWLYSKKRYTEAQQVLEKIASWNNCSHRLTVKLEEDDSAENVGKQSEKSQFAKAFRNGRFLAIFFIACFLWWAINMGYTGLAMGLSSIGGDIYINNLISGAAELVAYCFLFLVIVGGRKIIYAVLMAIGGVALIAAAVIQDTLPDLGWLTILTTMIGRLSLAAGWQIVYIWCLELFPTSIKATTMYISMFISHIGSAVAPFINDLGQVIQDPSIRGAIIAPAVYGTLLIMSSLLSLYLPETNNRPLPVTVEEATSNATKPYTIATPDETNTSKL